MANPVKEITSVRSRAATIAAEDDSLAPEDWVTCLHLKIVIEHAESKAAYWTRIANEGKAELKTLGVGPEDARTKLFMDYIGDAS